MLAGRQRLCDEWLFQLFAAAGVDVDRSSPFEIRSFSLRYLLSFLFLSSLSCFVVVLIVIIIVVVIVNIVIIIFVVAFFFFLLLLLI